ncbi:hypothetical protein GO998_07170 [Ralstonia syzygii]|uniref:Bacteriophage-related protein n=2 Tax=Ralstonia syzygii TaxID=28097 RepID=A0ABX7ZDT6_9RALS|nr:hypothetical protein GO998_07170 [Ralstonia syzygii]
MICVSQSEFARMCGVSRQAVMKWKLAGRLVLQGNQVDVEATDKHMQKYHEGGSPLRRQALDAVDTRLTTARAVDNSGRKLSTTPPALSIDAPHGQGRKGGQLAGCSKQPASTAEIEIKPGESVDEAASRLVGEIDLEMSFDEARRIKEVYLALLNRLEFEQKSGALIELDLASNILFEEFRAQRDAWLNWPTRVAPLLAAELGVEADRLTEVLTAHVHKQIAQLGEPEANFIERKG